MKIVKLNKAQLLILDGIKKLEEGKKIILSQRCNGRSIMQHELNKFNKIFKDAIEIEE
jgi:hypothetical protein